MKIGTVHAGGPPARYYLWIQSDKYRVRIPSRLYRWMWGE